MEDRNNSTYKGYEIVRAWHPRPGDTRRMAWNVVCDGKVRDVYKRQIKELLFHRGENA